MSETQPQAQDGLRTETGEIKDQSQKPVVESKPTTETQTQTPPPSTTEEKKSPDAKDGKSLLNQEDKKPDAAGAPEKYEPFKAPDGFVITPEATEQLSGLFKEAGISQASAQKLIDFVAPQLLDATEAAYKQYQEMRQGWQKEVMDQYGSKLEEVKVTTSRALAGVLTPQAHSAFKEAMDLTGAGDNPAFIHAFYEMAKRVSEGTHVKGGGPSKFGQSSGNKPQSAAQAMYPHLPSAG